MNYGISYMGSKTAIAEELIDLLPSGKRFVDLFGGGFAMSHCALLSGKYESVFYNEINPLVVELIRKAINGDYNYDRFKPEFITREKFFELKDKDGYVAYIWSFGNIGRTYFFGKDIEKHKQSLHNAVVFEDYSEAIKINDAFANIKGDTIKGRRLSCMKIIRQNLKNRCDLQHLRRLQRLQQLQQLERLQQLEQLQRLERLQQLQQLQRVERLQQLEQLERLQQLELNCGTYLDYEYKDGDIVYCDPPYEDTEKYCENGFNHQEFYDWVASRPYDVYFSSYLIKDDRFFNVNQKSKRVTLSSTNNIKKNIEILYCNNNHKLMLF